MEQKQSQEYAPMKENNSKSVSVKRAELHDNSPFGIVEIETVIEDGVEVQENNCFVALGDTRVSPLQTREECERMIDEKEWSLIIELVIKMIEEKDAIIKYKKGGTDKKTETK